MPGSFLERFDHSLEVGAITSAIEPKSLTPRDKAIHCANVCRLISDLHLKPIPTAISKYAILKLYAYSLAEAILPKSLIYQFLDKLDHNARVSRPECTKDVMPTIESPPLCCTLPVPSLPNLLFRDWNIFLFSTKQASKLSFLHPQKT